MKYFICNYSDLAEKKPYTLALDDFSVGVIKTGEELYAYENRCPHMDGPVCLGDVNGRVKVRLNEQKMAIGEYMCEDELHLVCPWHGMEFDLKSGTSIYDQKFKLRKLKVTVEEDRVFVEK